MKGIAIFLIDFYQKFISLVLKNLLGVSYFCRFKPTCSQYAKMAIQKEGVFLGGYHAVVRVLRCQPFSRLRYE